MSFEKDDDNDTPSHGDGELSQSVISQSFSKNKKKIAIGLLMFFVVLAMLFWIELAPNRDLQSVIGRPGNDIVEAKSHYEGWLNPSVLIYDLRDVSGNATRLDVFRVFLQFAEIQKSKKYERVVLCRNGEPRFIIDGAYFQEIGQEYEMQNPMYTIRTFPTHLLTVDGRHPYSEYEGGILGVLSKEMEQFSDFCDEWFRP